MRSRTGLSLLAIVATLLESTTAFWRMRCQQSGETRVAARVDPIVNKNELSTHAHCLAGGSSEYYILFNQNFRRAAIFCNPNFNHNSG